MQAAPPSSGNVLDDATGTPSHAAAMATVGCAAWKTFTQIPDLVNGDVTTFTFIFVGAGLAEPYHYVSDAFFAGLPAITSEASYELRVVSEAAAYSIRLAPVFPDAAKRDAAAVIMATARVAMRRAWGLKEADVVPSQLFTPRVTAGTPAVLEDDGTLAGPVANLATQSEWNAAVALVKAEWARQKDLFAPKVVQMGVDMPPCNGVTIVATNVHHYADPHKAICDAPYAQHIRSDSELPAAFTADEVKDLLCHKSGHIWRSPTLVYLGRSLAVKKKLNAIGHGAASVRIPALFTPEKSASAMQAVVMKASQAGPASNVIVATDLIDECVAATTKAIVDNPSQTGLSTASGIVEAFKQRHGAHVAWCAGFMAAMFDETRAPPRARSILDAYAIKGLIEAEAVSYAEGYEHYQLAARWRRSMAKEGHLVGHGLFGAKAPEAFINPVDEMKAKLEAKYGAGMGK